MTRRCQNVIRQPGILRRMLVMGILIGVSLIHSLAHAQANPVILTHASQVSIQGLSELRDEIQNAGYTVISVEEPHLYSITIEESAEFLVGEIERVSREFPGEKIKIVAICNGGLLTQYILKHYPHVAELISHFASFHSAHQGTRLADLGVFLNTLAGTPPILGEMTANAITAMNNSYFYRFASEEDYLTGLPQLTEESAWNSCLQNYAWLKCYTFFKLKLEPFLRWFFKVYGWDMDLLYNRYDEVLRAIMLEIYIADKHVKYEGNEDGYDLVLKMPFYQQEHADDPIIQDLIGRPLPDHVKVTNIYSCMDYIFKDYTRASLRGATNVVACPSAPVATEDHPYDEYMDLLTFHWSMYLDPAVIQRVIAGLE